MDIKIVHYGNSYKNQVANLFDDFQDYLVEIDPRNRLRRLLGYGENAINKTLKDVVDNEGVFYLALDKEKVVGFVVGLIERHLEKDLLGVIPSSPGRITELYVDAAYRGQGIAMQLMNSVEKYLKKKGCEVVKVEVFVPNEPARNLYKKFGYEPRDIDYMKKLD